MTEENKTDPQGGTREPKPETSKAPWKTPRLVEHGTITVRTLAQSGAVPAPAPPP
jgi:hypothetical protein